MRNLPKQSAVVPVLSQLVSLGSPRADLRMLGFPSKWVPAPCQGSSKQTWLWGKSAFSQPNQLPCNTPGPFW